MDFGIAKVMDAAGDNTLTSTGTIVGTPHYMSPWYSRAAELRDPEGEYQIGIRLLDGKGGFVRDEATGLQWPRRAADHGHSEAKRELAPRRGG